MVNKINRISRWLVCAALFTIHCSLFTACSDSDSGSSGTPEITGVRSCDPATADSLFTKGNCGQIIALIGNNLGGALKVYINDQEAYFNPTMNTDHSVVVTIPTEKNGFKLTAFDSSLKDEIRVETSHGSCTYAFKIAAGYPSISRIAADYPRETGDEINIYGVNLTDIEKAYFTDITSAQLDTTVWKEIGGNHVDVASLETVVKNRILNPMTNAYETTSQLKFTLPSLSFSEGTFVVETAGGTAYIPYYKNPGVPVILNISSDMPVIGEQLVINGQEFVAVNSISYGDVTLTADEFTVSDSQDQITIDFAKLPSKGSGNSLTVTTPGGQATVSFYDWNTMLNDMDGSMTDEGWGPNAIYEASPFGGNNLTAHINSYGQWWGQMIFFKKDWSGEAITLPDYNSIPADASTDDLYFAMEVYDNNSDFNSPLQTDPDNVPYQGYFRYELWFGNNISESAAVSAQYDNFAWDDYSAGTFTNPDGPVLQDINGQAHTGQWYRHVVRLSLFDAYKGLTYKDVYENGLGIMRIMSLTQGVKQGNVDVYFDNLRLVYIKK